MNVILDSKEFDKIIKEMESLKDENKKLKKANDFLNNQIREYNEEFAYARQVKKHTKEFGNDTSDNK